MGSTWSTACRLFLVVYVVQFYYDQQEKLLPTVLGVGGGGREGFELLLIIKFQCKLTGLNPYIVDTFTP